MGLTFTAILVISFILPGFLFRKGYYIYPYSKNYKNISSLAELANIVLWSVIIFIITYLILRNTALYKNTIKTFSCLYEDLLVLNTNDGKSVIKDCQIHNIAISLLLFWGISFYTGIVVNRLVIGFNLDQRIDFLRFKNEWYYYISARILDKMRSENSKHVDFTMLDVLVGSQNRLIIYTGICVDYYLDNYGNLSSLFLRGTHIKVNDGEYREMPTGTCIIPSNNIVNINIRYIEKIDKKERFTITAPDIIDLLTLYTFFNILFGILNIIISLPILLYRLILRFLKWIKVLT